MSRRKTQQGVEIRNTFGMKLEKKIKTWVMSMNRTQAKIFDWEPEDQSLTLVKVWNFPEGKVKGTELVWDQPGRVFDAKTFARGGHQTATPRHSYASRTDPKELLTLKNVKVVVDWVEKNKVKSNVTDLICVAEPRLIGMVQKQMRKKYRDELQKKWDRDFRWLNEDALKARLVAWLTGRELAPVRLLPKMHGAFGEGRKVVPKTAMKKTGKGAQYGA